jgi:hypothetical protein
MIGRLLTWAVLLYLAIDLANPFVPGAFRFTPEEGLVWVEGTSGSREKAQSGASEARESAPVPPAAVSDGRLLVTGPPATAGYLAAWLVRVRTGDPPARDLPPPDADDH